MSTVEHCCRLLLTIPRVTNANRISWSDSVKTVAEIVACILTSQNQVSFIKELCAKSKTNWQIWRKFCHGKNSADKDWYSLQELLTEMKISWNVVGVKNKEEKISPIPHTPLVVVAGSVTPIKPIPPPTTVIAKSGEFAKSNVKTIRKTSTDQDGNFVITTISTRTVLMGTDEYKALVIKAFNKTPDSVAV